MLHPRAALELGPGSASWPVLVPKSEQAYRVPAQVSAPDVVWGVSSGAVMALEWAVALGQER